MSEKRFKFIKDFQPTTFVDMKNGKHYNCGEVCDLLDEQQSIIDGLKKRINELESIVADDINSRYEIKEAWKERTRKRW